MKDRLAEWEDKSIQASRFGWMSERRKGMGGWFKRIRVLFIDFSIRGVGPVGGVC